MRVFAVLLVSGFAAVVLSGCTTTGERLTGAGVGAVGGGVVAGPVGAVVGGVGGAVVGPSVAHSTGVSHRTPARKRYVAPQQ
jgi:osmotically inducible lipoprotein OsmB